MSRFKLLYFVIFIINNSVTNAQISDKRLCVDEECKVPISYAKTLLRYSSPDSRILSFAPNVDITIYSKSAGSREDLWGAEINGKRGYIPKHMVREIKIINKATLLVDTEFSNETESSKVPSDSSDEKNVLPDKVQEAFEVVDGTTIYLNPQDIEPSSTESPEIQSTALPDSPDQKETENVVKSGSEDSVVDNVLSKISDWIKDDKSEEAEDDEADDEELDEENDEDEDEESEEANDSDKQNHEPNTLNSTGEADQTIPKLVPLNAEIGTNEPQVDVNEVKIEAPTPLPPLSEEITQSIQDDQISVEDNKEKVVDSNIPPLNILNNLLSDSAAKEPIITSSENINFNQQPKSVPERKDLHRSIPIPETKEEEINSTSDISEKSAPSSEHKIEEPIAEPIIGSTIEEAVPSTEPKIEEPPIEPAIQPKIEEPSIQSVDVQKIKEPTPSIEPPKVEEPVVQPIIEEKTQPKNENAEIHTLFEPKNEELATEQHPVEPKIEDQPPIIQETTTLMPEIEVPNPFEDQFLGLSAEAVTYSSSEEVEVSTLPSLESLEDFTTEKKISEDDIQAEENSKEVVVDGENSSENSPGIISGIFSMFTGKSNSEEVEDNYGEQPAELRSNIIEDKPIETLSEITHNSENTCNGDSYSEPSKPMPEIMEQSSVIEIGTALNSDFFLYLVTTAISVIIFLFGYIAFDKNKREGPLVAKINKLQKDLLVLTKENQILQEKGVSESGYDTNDHVSSELVDELRNEIAQLNTIKANLEDQIQSLEKELENSTEVGMELNRMLSEILSSQSGSDVIKANIDKLQRQLVEQQSTINSVNETLAITNTENHELKLELEISNKKVLDLQAELDKMALNVMKIEEEKDSQQNLLEAEVIRLKQKLQESENKLVHQDNEMSTELNALKLKLSQVERNFDLKNKEFAVLTDTLKQLKVVKNSQNALKDLLEVAEIKAELELLRSENKSFAERIQQEQEAKILFEKKAQSATKEAQELRNLYDEADKLKVETQTKLEVLSNYFKEREAQLQKEISKHEALWAEKQGEATSTSERTKFMQEQLQNYKSQYESLKQEIISQEVELKSQISVLEKKAHENWVAARQAERKLEDAKQEAAQLRHRLTLRERAIQDEKGPHRLQSPMELNGDLPVSPIESPASPPLIYGGRDHITKSPPLPGLPPFLPPPPGVPFMPPPPFIPPPPTMFPGDHRPPPLGRMSSPPINPRYSPSSRGYSPYDSSPSDSEYGTSPPQRRAFSPYDGRDDRKEYKRGGQGRSNGRNMKGVSSGSANSNESLEKIKRKSKV